MRDLAPGETRVLELLTEADDAYAALPELHEDYGDEFTDAIHVAYNIVAARPAVSGANVAWPDSPRPWWRFWRR